MNIGQLIKDDRGYFLGRIETATIHAQVGLRRVVSQNANAPKFDVMLRAKSGNYIPVGGLWEKEANNGTGMFLQGTIDDPSFPAPLSVALFAQDEETFNVAWSRPKQRARNPFEDNVPQGDDENSFAPREEMFGADGGDTSELPPRRQRRRKANEADDANPFATASGLLEGAAA